MVVVAGVGIALFWWAMEHTYIDYDSNSHEDIHISNVLWPWFLGVFCVVLGVTAFLKEHLMFIVFGAASMYFFYKGLKMLGELMRKR